MLVKLCAFCERNETKFGIILKKKARDFALKTKKVDEYMGYMAWAEIYISLPDKRDLGL
jgi:hypothetical protein